MTMLDIVMRFKSRRPQSNRRADRLKIEPLESRTLLTSDLIITEFVANNRQGLRDDDGDRSDWIEIYNAGAEAVDLSGYYLTDDAQDLTQWRLPAQVLDPKAYEVVFASGKDRRDVGSPLHTSFRLRSAGETLMLVEPDGKTVAFSYVDYPTQHEDVSFGVPQPIDETELVGRASPVKYLIPTAENPGSEAAWAEVDFDDAEWSDGVGSVGYDNFNQLNEFIDTDIEDQMLNITTTAYLRYSFQLDDVAAIQEAQFQVRYDDGYVAYLNGVEVARRRAPEELTYDSMATDSRPVREKPLIEPVDISDNFLDLLAVGENVLAFHGLNRSHRLGFFVSPELIVQQPGDVSVDQHRYFEAPSPGAPNGDVSYEGVLNSVDISVERGFYDVAQEVVVASRDLGASLTYTLDGSTPSATNGTIVPPSDPESPATATVPIAATSMLRATTVKEDHLSAPPQTNTYVFVDDVIMQSPDGEAPAGWPSGSVNGQVLTYGMDPDVVEDPEYAPLMRDALMDIPSFSLVTDQEHLFDPETGIFVNADTARPDTASWERPTSVELIYPDGTEGFQIDAGVRIRGGNSRNDRNAKHAFRLFFRTEYGESKLRYPMFGDEGVDEFDNIDLRSPSLPSWHSCNLGHPRWGCKRSTFLRDIWGRDSQRDMGQPYTRSQYYHLYLNGQYWGLFQSQERPEASYAESYFGGDKSDYDVIKVEGIPRHVAATDGTTDMWRQLWDMAVEGFESDEAYFRAQGLNSDGTRNPEYPVLLNVENLVDYMVLQYYSGNWDGPISDNINHQETNNWIGILDREGDSGFRFFAHDGEYMMFDVETNQLGPWTAGDTFQHSNPQWLHQQLVKNEQYRSFFGDRAYKHLFNDGVFTPENSRARLLARMEQMDLAIIAESARWGDSFRLNPFTKEDWLTEVNWILDTFLPQRTEIVIEQFRNAPVGAQSGLIAPILPWVDAPTFSQHGGQIHAGFELSMAATDEIYFTIDGSDPRQHVPVIDFEKLVKEGDSIRFHIPADDSHSGQWMLSDFDDAAWAEGTSAIGFERNAGPLEGAIATDISETMLGINSSVYMRLPFSIDDPNAFEVLELAMQYDDGFVAYLNGTEVSRSNLRGDDPSWDSRALPSRTTRVDLRTFETVDLTDQLHLLRPGNNVLAIHGVNGASNDGDFFLLPELRAGTISDVGVSPSAENYATPIVLDENTVVSVRSLRGHQWSALNQVTFTVNPMPLRVSEIMYHPAEPTATEEMAGFADDDDFEYLELENTSETETLDLTGVTLSEAVDYTFPALELGPGQRLIVARNAEAFQLRYGTNAEIAGEYGEVDEGGRLNNGGELIRLSGRLGILIQEFTYDDAWFANTDGEGFSLEALENASPEQLSTSSAWRSSFVAGGTPGDSQIAPVDFDNDELLGCADIDALVTEIVDGDNPTEFDLTSDGFVDNGDVDVWLASAGSVNLQSHEAYLRGDVNLNGVVNVADLNIIGTNWLQDGTGWCGGDSNADGAVDALDLNKVGLNWLRDVSGQEAMADERVPRAPLAAAVGEFFMATETDGTRHLPVKTEEVDLIKSVSVEAFARRRTRSYTGSSSIPPAAEIQTLTNVNELRLTDEVLKRWRHV